MRTKLLGTAVALMSLGVSFGLAGSASASGQAGGTAHREKVSAHRIYGTQRFEVYATNFQASFAPIYFTGLITTAGIGYKHFAEATDQAFLPKGNGTIIIYHPGLTQTSGVTNEFDPTTCVDTIKGSGPVYLKDGTGKFAGIRGSGTVDLNIRIFERVAADGSCDQTQPPWGYIEIAKGQLKASLPR